MANAKPNVTIKNLEEDEEVQKKLQEEKEKLERSKIVETDISKMGCWGKIQNQQIPHILITPTFKCAVICYLILAVLLGGFGALCLTSAMANNDMLIRYDDKCNGQAICVVEFTPEKDLESPKIYYKLENFYANHRNFVKSRNYKQLRGNDLSAADLGTSCDPVLKMADLYK